MGISPGVSKSINVDAKSLAVHHHGHHHHHRKHGHHHHHANVGAQGQISLSKTNQTMGVKMMKGELSVNGPLPADFGDRFAKEVAKATGCKPEDVKVLNTSVVPGETGIDEIIFEAPVDVIKAVEEQAADPKSKLATGPLRLFLIDKDADDSDEDSKKKGEDEEASDEKEDDKDGKKEKAEKKEKKEKKEKTEKEDDGSEDDDEDKKDKEKESIEEEDVKLKKDDDDEDKDEKDKKDEESSDGKED